MIKTIPVSCGEILDKISILEIKQKNIIDSNKLRNISLELEFLKKESEDIFKKENIKHLYKELKEVNEKLWQIEDLVRLKEKQKIFDEEFIDLARSVYITNDKRYEIKKTINETLNSTIKEEKFYEQY
jgi:hypothetical protein